MLWRGDDAVGAALLLTRRGVSSVVVFWFPCFSQGAVRGLWRTVPRRLWRQQGSDLDNSRAVISVDTLIRAEWAQVLASQEDLINNNMVEDFDCITGRGTFTFDRLTNCKYQ